MKRPFKYLVGLTLVVATTSVQAIPIQDLFNGQSITAGDKLFDQWQLNLLDTSDPALDPDLSNIDVTPLSDGGNDPGPGLSFNPSNELSVTGDDIFAFIDLQFGFRVSPLGNERIEDNSLDLLSSTRTLVGDNGSFINETIGTAPGLDDLGSKFVEFSFLDPLLGGPGAISNLFDSAKFDPQDEVFVTKNILVWATGSNEQAALGGFEQRFSQVPEPSILLLLSFGLAGVGLARKRRASPRP